MGLKDFLFNNDYSFLLQIAIILLSTKLLGLLTKRISLPQVVGALAAGIVLGPMVLNVVQRNDLIVSLAELGVIVLMFSAGLETDIQELKKAGLASFVIALLGVIVPLVGGFFLADFYNTEQNPEMAKLFWQNIFIGVVLTATSVSITVETLKELGALNSRAGKGSEVGSHFEELRAIMDLVEKRDKLGICLDTCHVWDGGYDIVNDLDGVLTEFDRIIGLDHLKAIHLNDSLNPLGSHKDRHARIGEGQIGLDALVRVIRHPALEGKPFILETPNDDEGWTREIALLRERYSE